MADVERTILVLESRPRWEPSLKWDLAGLAIRIRPCRTWGELSREVAAQRAGLDSQAMIGAIVVDPTGQMDGLLNWLASRPALGDSLFVVVCPDDASDLEWILRDAGVHEVLFGDAAKKSLSRLCRNRCEPQKAAQ